MHTSSPVKALALFSGGLDSILAAKLLLEQSIEVKCLHFVTPFFGNMGAVRRWSRLYGLDIEAIDVSEDFIDLLRRRPPHGFGKVLNPCVDCKILLLSKARELLEHYGASFLVSGEVLGQRPMSQRKDALYLIRREAEVKELLLRPLSALKLDPTPMEEQGLVDRSRLLGIFGRGRKDQLELAERYGLREIPTPAGGCRLTEKENARRYWPVLRYSPHPAVNDFLMVDTGRHYRVGSHGLSIGRDKADNEALMSLSRDGDLLFKVAGFPGPVAVGRAFGAEWADALVLDAASFISSFSPKAVAEHGPVKVRVARVENGEAKPAEEVVVTPLRTTPLGWREDPWPELREEIRAEMRANQSEPKFIE